MILLVKMTSDLGGVINECEEELEGWEGGYYNFVEEVRSQT